MQAIVECAASELDGFGIDYWVDYTKFCIFQQVLLSALKIDWTDPRSETNELNMLASKFSVAPMMDWNESLRFSIS